MRTVPLTRWVPRVEPRLSVVPLPLIGLYLLALPVLLWRLEQTPAMWFDEGFRANQAYVLVTTGQYATASYDAVRPFDPAAGTGPADLLPIAATYALFGPGIWQSRLPSVAYALFALTGVYLLGRWFRSWQTGLLAALLILAAPTIGDTGFLWLGRQVMGEIPSVALVLLGLWLWFRSWEVERSGRSLWRASLPGLLVGLGLLSKTQGAFGLLPGLTLVVAARVWRLRRSGLRRLAREVAPWVAIAIVMVGWQMLSRFSVDEARQTEYAAMLSVTVGTNLLTTLFGQTLSTSAWAMFGFMVVVVLVSGGMLARRARAWQPRTWAHLTLTLIVAGHALWFALVSIGWTRYAFSGWVLAWFLLGLGANALLRRPEFGAWPWRVATLALVGAVILSNVTRILAEPRLSQIETAATYIRTNLPADAVIESWEWELDALTRRADYSRPGQADQMAAIRRVFYPSGGPESTYDVLRNDPDYLIIGRMAAFTQVYRAEVVAAEFDLMIRIGDYAIYRRQR